MPPGGASSVRPMLPRRGCVWAVVKPLLILCIAGGLMTIAAWPWAIPWPGRDTLDGSWIGEVCSNRGPQTWLLLSLEPSRICEPWLSGVLTGGGTPLGGHAMLCTAELFPRTFCALSRELSSRRLGSSPSSSKS